MLKRKKKLTDIGFFDFGFLKDLDTVWFFGFGLTGFRGYWMIDYVSINFYNKTNSRSGFKQQKNNLVF